MTAVIIGAGHAGVQAAESLRNEGYGKRIVLLDRAAHLPYQRPPLSKDYMKPDGDPHPMPLRGAAFYGEHDIDLELGAEVTEIDAAAKSVRLRAGRDIPYGELIIATGAEARRATCVGSDLAGIHYLRTLEDAEALRAQLTLGQGRVVVVGAGFIGLEFAAVAAQRGLEVTVIDFASRPMQRVLTPSMSDYFAQVHRELGVHLHFEEGLARFAGTNGRVTGVEGTTGTSYPCDFAVVGLGVATDDALFASAGAACTAGLLVDECLRTNLPDVYAIGDVAVFPSRRFGGSLRLESVQNATDMGRTVAKNIVGPPERYDVSPWFWSNQGPARLQIAGLADPADAVVERGARASGKFSQFIFRDGNLVAVESVNSPAHHVAARKLLGSESAVTLEELRQHDFDLKGYMKGLVAT